MNVIVCTSVGLLVVVAGAAAYCGFLYLVCSATEKISLPAPVSKTVKCVFLVLVGVSLIYALLWIGHDIGCRTIHFAMRH